jgi:hypothetical protein
VVSGLGQAPSQVLPGGIPDEQPIDTEGMAQAARDAARAEAERIIERQMPADEDALEPEAEVVELDVEPTEGPTPPSPPPTSPAAKATTAAVGTPTAKAPTVGRTPAAAPVAAEAAKKKESSSWFGCQVTTSGRSDGSIFLLIGIAGVLINRMRRKAKRSVASVINSVTYYPSRR